MWQSAQSLQDHPIPGPSWKSRHGLTAHVLGSRPPYSTWTKSSWHENGASKPVENHRKMVKTIGKPEENGDLTWFNR